MDGAWFTLIGFLVIAIGFSFLCSVLEAVILSINPSFIAGQKGNFAKQLEELKRDIDKPLAAILTLNTFAHTIGAAGVGAAAQDIWGESSLAIVSAVATILILIFSEIIPKTIGAVYWEKLASPVVFTTKWLTIILFPLVWLCQLITKLFRHGKEESILSRQTISTVVTRGYRDGLIRQHEHDLIANLMKKDKLTTNIIMTPIDRLVAAEENAKLASIDPKSDAWHVSRIPLFKNDVDHIESFVLKDEVLAELVSGHKDWTMDKIARPILKVKGKNTLTELYHLLVDNDQHVAIVQNELGKSIGIVTMEDVIEEILGQEIVDESDRERGVLD